MPYGPNPIVIDESDDHTILVARPGMLSKLTYTSPPLSRPEPPCIFSLFDDSGRPPRIFYRVNLTTDIPLAVPGLTDLISGAEISFLQLSVICPPGAEFTCIIS
jgi:hypothetical protein